MCANSTFSLLANSEKRGYKMDRNNTKVIHIGDRVIGGGNPILIQSMTNVPTEDVEACVAQILKLEEAGCEIIRCTVPTLEAAKALAEMEAKANRKKKKLLP